MPVTAPITAPIFLAELAANSIIGISAPQLALAIATGFEIYCSSGLTVLSTDVGTAGAGIGLGVGMILAPPILDGAFISSFAAGGLLGTFSPLLVNALALGFSTVLAQAIIQVTSVGVGVGTGVALLVPNPAASLSAYISGFAAAGISGANAIQMITAISTGFDLAAASAIGVIVIAGPPSIIPSAGVGTGILL